MPVWVIFFSEAPKYSRSPGCRSLAIHGGDAAPFGLRLRVARHGDAAPPAQHLREAGAIVAVTRSAAPGVGQAEEALGEFQGFGDGEPLGIERDIARLHPTGTVVGQAHLEPAGVLLGLGDHLESALKGHGDQGGVFGDAGLAVDVGKEALHLGDAPTGGIRFAGEQRGERGPAQVIVGRADVGPSVFLFQNADIGAVDGLRDHVGIGAGARVHVGHGLEHHGGGKGRGEERKHCESWHMVTLPA